MPDVPVMYRQTRAEWCGLAGGTGKSRAEELSMAWTVLLRVLVPFRSPSTNGLSAALCLASLISGEILSKVPSIQVFGKLHVEGLDYLLIRGCDQVWR